MVSRILYYRRLNIQESFVVSSLSALLLFVISGKLIVSRYVAESITTDAGRFSHVNCIQKLSVMISPAVQVAELHVLTPCSGNVGTCIKPNLQLCMYFLCLFNLYRFVHVRMHADLPRDVARCRDGANISKVRLEAGKCWLGCYNVADTSPCSRTFCASWFFRAATRGFRDAVHYSYCEKYT